jgi:hypothetical protein
VNPWQYGATIRRRPPYSNSRSACLRIPVQMRSGVATSVAYHRLLLRAPRRHGGTSAGCEEAILHAVEVARQAEHLAPRAEGLERMAYGRVRSLSPTGWPRASEGSTSYAATASACHPPFAASSRSRTGADSSSSSASESSE